MEKHIEKGVQVVRSAVQLLASGAFLVASTFASGQEHGSYPANDNYSDHGIQQIVFKNNQGLQVVPYTIALLVIEGCYGNFDDTVVEQDAYECPTLEAFQAFTDSIARDEDFQAAIQVTAQREALRDNLTNVNNVLAGRSNAVGNMVRVSSNQSLSLREAFATQMSDTYEQHLAHYQSPSEVFGRVVQGLFALNIERSTANEFMMSKDSVAFLYQFKDQSGNPLFKDSLQRIEAASALADMDIRYKFLKDEESWTIAGVEHKWRKSHEDMEQLYLSLITPTNSLQSSHKPMI